MVEDYWMALSRDVPFSHYGAEPITAAAIRELNTLSNFKGPKVSGKVTPATLFRGIYPGDLIGPYLSQFLLPTVNFGALSVPQLISTYAPGVDYLTTFATWLAVQNGQGPFPANSFASTTSYIKNGRDLGAYVHLDTPFQAYLVAAQWLLTHGAPLNPGNPYLTITNQAYPEGNPQHPSYAEGHGVIAGACVTALKAFFNDTLVIANPVVASDNGQSLLLYTGADAGQITVGGELNKLADNIALGRDMAGAHWRSDAEQALLLGEAVTISILRDQRPVYNEPFNGFTFTKFDGTTITV